MTAVLPFEPDGLPADVERLASAARRVETPCGAGRMVWRIWGAGPPLLLLHGGYGSWMHWVRTIPAFMDRYAVYAPDIPGLGESDDAPDPGAPASIAQATVDGLRELGVHTAALDLVGFSFGGVIGGHVSAIAPLRSLTLVGPGALGLPRSATVLERESPDMSAGERRAVHGRNLNILMIADAARIDDAAVAIQAANVPRARVKSRRLAATEALADALQRARPEALHWIFGERDQVVGPHMGTRFDFARAHRPDATFTVIPGAGHWAPYEAPEAFNAVLRRLLEQPRVLAATAGPTPS